MSLRTLFARVLVVVAVAGWGVAAVSTQSARAQDNSNAKQELAKEYKAAQQAVNENNLDQAATHLENVIDLAEEVGNTDLANNARSNLVKIRQNLGNQLLEQENYQAAIEQFDSGIEFAPDYPANYFLKGLALKRTDNPEQAMTWYRRAINVAEETGQTSIIDKAQTNMATIFLERANQAFQQENFQQSITHLDSANTHIDFGAQHQFYYARAHNGLSNWQEALDHANQGLELVNQSNQQLTSNLNYMRGVALKNLGQLADACGALQTVSAGPFQQNAQYELEHNLECNQSASN